MKTVFLAFSLSFSLLGCSNSSPAIKETNFSAPTSAECREKYSAVCTMELLPTICEGVGPKQQKLSATGSNRCDATANFKASACSAGLDDEAVKKLTVQCKPQN